MASSVQSIKYVAINTTDTSAMVYYVIKFVSEPYTLHDNTKCDKQIMSSDELVPQAQYLRCIQ